MPARRAIGVDIGGRRLLAGAVDDGLDVHYRTQRALDGLDQSALLAAAVDAVEETRNAAGAEIAAVGFGVRGRHERSEGADGSVVAALAGLELADVMSERLGLPAFLGTVPSLAALAEHRAGAARGARDAIVFTIDTGIRAGLILGGELQHGPPPGLAHAAGEGSELADSAFEAAQARPASGLSRALGASQEPSGSVLAELAHDGDAAAEEALARLGRRLGITIADAVNAYNPQVVVVGGEVLAAGALLLGPARAELASRNGLESGDATPVVPARFGADAVIAGAAALALERSAPGRSEAA
jgi:glucokinase